MKPLQTLMEEMKGHISDQALSAPGVSSASVGWHIEHSLLVLDTSVKALHKSEPAEYKWSFSFWRTVIYLSGRLPRGKAKAPERVLPSQTFDEDSLWQHLRETEERLLSISTLSKDHFMKHPYFGMLCRKDTIRFMELHTRHHMKIIQDILRNLAA